MAHVRGAVQRPRVHCVVMISSKHEIINTHCEHLNFTACKAIIGASLSKPHIDGTTARFHICIYYIWYDRHQRTALGRIGVYAPLHTYIDIHVFDTALCTWLSITFFVQRSALLFEHGMAMMNASKQDAMTSEGARGPAAPRKALERIRSEHLRPLK